MSNNIAEYNSYEPVYELVTIKLPNGTIHHEYKLMWKAKINKNEKNKNEENK